MQKNKNLFTEALIKTAWGITMKADCIPSFISQVRDLHTPGSAPLDNSSR